jgi:HD superfamily phosphohydrolase
MENLYNSYKELLGSIPEFLYKYLDLDILIRLKDISIFCGMEYGSPYMYDFGVFISRYDHSLNVALITWNLTHDKTSTLASLFHDVSSPTFSHVVDFMNGDLIKQESTEELTSFILLNNKKLNELLNADDVNIYDVINYKNNSIVDTSRPKMCADRLDGIISVSIGWTHIIDYYNLKKIISNLILIPNEDNQLEIGFKNREVGEYLIYINQEYDRMTSGIEDYYMMDLMARILKLCLELGIFKYEDLYILTEHEILDIIEENTCINDALDKLWLEFKTTKYPTINSTKIVKKKKINPLIYDTKVFRVY